MCVCVPVSNEQGVYTPWTPPVRHPPGKTPPGHAHTYIYTSGHTPQIDTAPREMTIEAGGTHPTGMHSCYIINLAIIISYDRLFGDYESLINGYAADALVDFTGGVPESLDLTKMELSSVEVRDNLFGDILDASENRALIMCHILVSLQLSFLQIE